MGGDKYQCVFKLFSVRALWHRCSLQIALQHTWYIAAGFLPVFHSRLMNESGAFHPPLPPMGPTDKFLVPSQGWAYGGDWVKQVMRFSTGNSAPFEFSKKPPSHPIYVQCACVCPSLC